jgi:outer membrane protein assembly factor BamD
MPRNITRYGVILGIFAVVLASSGCRKKVYENPITKDTQQPDKVLFDTAIDDVEHGRYERARLTLQTMMNTYDTSEYLAKAKLAMADSWYREGGSHGLAQAEAEYQDFIVFYGHMEEAAEAQQKICQMQYQQMDKSDRDPLHAFRAQEECKKVLLNFPNSKFVPQAEQYLRNVQEVLADEEFRVGSFYRGKGSQPAAANRFQAMANQFPLYSRADEGLWLLADTYQRMGDNFESQEAAAFSKLVREYPLSPHAGVAKERLKEMGQPVPEADPVAYARQKYELENRSKRSFMSRAWGPFASHPDLSAAAKSGKPNMDGFHPTVAASVPEFAAGVGGRSSDNVVGVAPSTTNTVTIDTGGNENLIKNAPDARLGGAPGSAPATAPAAGTTPAAGGAVAPADATTPAGAAQAAGTAPAAGTAATPAAQTQLPVNHLDRPGKPRSLAQQQKDMARQQAQMKKLREKQIKAQEDLAKKAAKKKGNTPDQQQQPPVPAPATVKQ